MTLKKRTFFLIAAVVGSGLLPQDVAAESKIAACRAIADAGQRLACFDAITGRGDEEVSGDRLKRQKANFGLTERQKPVTERNEVETESAKIVRVSGRSLMLDNGQVWQVGPDSRLIAWVRTGDLATIGHGALSGYRISVKGIPDRETVKRIR